MRTVLTVSVGNFLSFRQSDITLGPLNLLVGPNGAGKTNFLKVFQFLGDVARLDLLPAIDSLGSFDEMRFRGAGASEEVSIRLTGAITEHAHDKAPDEYDLSFKERLVRVRHRVSNGGSDLIPLVYRHVDRSETIVLKRTKGRGRRITLKGRNATFAPRTSKQEPRTLSVQEASSGLNTLRKLGKEYEAPQVEALAKVFENLRLFEVDVASIRRPSHSGTPSTLAPDGSNVAYFLQWLASEHHQVFEQVCEDIRFVLPGFEEFRFVPLGGSGNAIRLDIKEQHINGTTSLARASFGTIRAIALFAMLHDPFPPRLTCLEEVDHGFHPHALDRVVDRMREASRRTQIIAASHSPALVNRVKAEELIVFEKDPNTGATRIVDVDPKQVNEMEEESGYRLGELWFSGLLGGGLDQEG